MLVCHSCDNKSPKKDTLRIHKCVKNKAKLSNCDKCEYSCTKNEVPVMHKFRKYGGQEPPRKLCKLCDFTCLTTDGLSFIIMLNIQDYRYWRDKMKQGKADLKETLDIREKNLAH